MKKAFTIIYSIFASLAFIFAISFFCLNLYEEYSHSEVRNEKLIKNLISDLSKAGQNPNISTRSLVKRLDKTLGNFDDFSYLQISINGIDVVKYPENQTKEETSSKLTQRYEKICRTAVGNFIISANLYLLRPVTIIYYAKISFIIVLAVTILTIIFIIFSNVTNHLAGEEKNVTEFYKNNKIEETCINVKNNTDKNLEEITEENAHEHLIIDEENSENQVEDHNDGPQISSEQINEKISLPLEEEKPLELKNENNETEQSYSLTSGLGLEKNLNERLENEISRAVAEETDISLFIIQTPEIPRDSELFKKITEYLLIQFQFKDLLFEYKDDRIAAIKINMDLDNALNSGDKIYSDIKNIIDDKPCYIGISTRSVRIVSGQRLLTEAEQALEHAKSDNEPVIAFRVDADKYRQFLEQNQNH